MRRLFGGAEPLETADHLRRSMASRSAFISQKSAIEYCRARAGLNWDKLFKEMDFQAALERCRWEALSAVALDVAVVIEGFLRPHWTGPLPVLADRLAVLLGEGLTELGTPPYRPDGWAGLVADTRERLALAQLGAPKPAYEVAVVGAERLFEVLPIHTNLRQHDREMVVNGVRFLMTRYADDLTTSLRPGALARDLASAG
jgi:hypothetical protein